MSTQSRWHILEDDLQRYYQRLWDKRSGTPDIQYKLPPEIGYITDATILSTLGGFFIGSFLGYSFTSLQFTAENAHQKPRTKGGWYVYHKNKQFKSLYVATNRGVGTGVRFGAISAFLMTVETALDVYEEKLAWWHGAVAGLSTATIFTVMNRLPFHTARPIFGIGCLAGLAMGGLNMLTYGDYDDKYKRPSATPSLPVADST